MDQNQLTPPPRHLKPWYYQDWFLYPVIVFWPVWAVLILRSPWHNGLVSGAVAWAMLIVGGYLIFWEQLIQTGSLNSVAVVLATPGLILTALTQVFWMQDKPRITRASRPEPEAPAPQAPPPSSPRRSRRRRRAARRR